MRILIAGFGFAGSLLAYFLKKKGADVFVADDDYPVTSTKISAGVMLPVTGRRLAKTYLADRVLPFAHETYREIENLSGESFFRQLDVLQLFTDVANRNSWFARSGDADMDGYAGTIFSKSEIHDSVISDFGGILLKKCGSVFPSGLLNAILKIVNEGQQTVYHEKLSYDDLVIQSNHITWKKREFDRIIFCQGFERVRNPLFGYIPFKPAKGEILDFTAEKLDDRYIINGPVFILPLGNGRFRAGSTYNWETLDTVPTEEARQILESGIRNIVNIAFEITGHVAAVRPAVIDRRPVIGFHPEFPTVGIFNGLGTKGAMLSPWFADQFSECILSGRQPDREVNVSRFNRLYQER